MKLAIISDTHGNAANFKKVIDWLNKKNIQLVLHCGDIGDTRSLKESLEYFRGNFFGVFGNVDEDSKILVEEYNKISRVKVNKKVLKIKVENKNIAVTHRPDDAKRLAKSEKFNLVFYGHTHKPWEEKIGNCRVINPGELAGHILKPTFAIYDIGEDLLELKILEKL